MKNNCLAKGIIVVPRVMRGERGELMAEFAAALAILICCIFIPLTNLAAVPVRYLIGYSMVSEFTHKLSLAEKRSQAITLTRVSSPFEKFAREFGISVGDSELSVLCKNNESETLTVANKEPIPQAWLPGGSKGPCIYLLQNRVDITIQPILSLSLKAPGLTSPLSLTVQSDAPWENLSCDPLTRQFYINE